MGLFKRNCSTNYAPAATPAPAPNPDPSRWRLLEKKEFPNGHVLKIKYLDCTNFEGVKVLVYEGKYSEQSNRDPHFHNSPFAPIARFRPDARGWNMACDLASGLAKP